MSRSLPEEGMKPKWRMDAFDRDCVKSIWQLFGRPLYSPLNSWELLGNGSTQKNIDSPIPAPGPGTVALDASDLGCGGNLGTTGAHRNR